MLPPKMFPDASTPLARTYEYTVTYTTDDRSPLETLYSLMPLPVRRDMPTPVLANAPDPDDVARLGQVLLARRQMEVRIAERARRWTDRDAVRASWLCCLLLVAIPVGCVCWFYYAAGPLCVDPVCPTGSGPGTNAAGDTICIAAQTGEVTPATFERREGCVRAMGIAGALCVAAAATALAGMVILALRGGQAQAMVPRDLDADIRADFDADKAARRNLLEFVDAQWRPYLLQVNPGINPDFFVEAYDSCRARALQKSGDDLRQEPCTCNGDDCMACGFCLFCCWFCSTV